MSVISNTTVLSNFAEIDQLDLLRQLFVHLYLPTQVYEEIQLGLEEGYQFYNNIPKQIYPFSENGWLHLTGLDGENELRDLQKLPSVLHSGEAACLTIAHHRKWLLLTDDRAARKTAVQWNIALSGSIGCLILAVEKKVCSLAQANQHLNTMIQAGYRSPTTDLTSFLNQTKNDT